MPFLNVVFVRVAAISSLLEATLFWIPFLFYVLLSYDEIFVGRDEQI